MKRRYVEGRVEQRRGRVGRLEQRVGMNNGRDGRKEDGPVPDSCMTLSQEIIAAALNVVVFMFDKVAASKTNGFENA